MKQRIRAFLTENWLFKVLSLLLAIVLWFVVIREGKVVVLMHVPVGVKDLPADMVIVNDPEDLVSVKVRGPRSLVADLVLSQIDLPQEQEGSRLRPGENRLRIDSQQVAVPRGIEVLSVTPPTIAVVVERLVERELPIKPRLEGSPARGFTIRGVSTSPARVRVKGPERIMRELAGMPTVPISVEGRRESLRQLAHLESPSRHITWNDGEMFQVVVTVEIGRRED